MTLRNNQSGSSIMTHPTYPAQERGPMGRKFARFARETMDEGIFEEKSCNVFCPESKNPQKCQCGLLEAAHPSSVPREPGREWKTEDCTRKTALRCYGSIKFKHSELDDESKFIRVSNDTNIAKLVDFMHKNWRLKRPALIISLTGGAKDFDMARKEHEKLKTGIMKVAATKGAWVITGGTNAGIMKICGEAISHHLSTVNLAQKENQRLVTIGIATWGAVPDNDQLVPPETHKAGPYSTHYEMPREMNKTGLDPNHTHFILCDDGSSEKYGREQAMRGEIERVLCENGVSTSKRSTKVPIVCVMVEGGPGTIDTVRNALINGTPCVVIDGSGRAANVLAYAVDLSKDAARAEDVKEQITARAKSLLGDNKLEQNVAWIEECLLHKDMIRVYKLDEESGQGELDKAILQTLLEVGGLEVKEQIDLAVLWNRPDMAEQVLKGSQKDKLDVSDIREFATRSLIDNKLDFIRLFLERLNLQQFLTKGKLEEIYNETLGTSSEFFLLKALESDERKGRPDFRNLENIEKVLINKYNVYYKPEFLVPAGESALQNGTSDKPAKVKANKVSTRSSDDSSKFLWTFKCPERELFVYSLLFIRPDCADYFWDDMMSKTAAALFAAQLCQAIKQSPVTRVDTNLMNKVQSTLVAYQDKAEGIMDECYQRNYKYTKMILRSPHTPWGKQTCLELALKSDSKEFIAKSGCQKLIIEVWHGAIDDSTSIWRILAAVLFPPFIWSIWFRKDVADEHKELKEKQDSLEKGDSHENQFKQEEILPTKSDSFEMKALALETTTKDLTIPQRYKHFYDAPVVTFILNVISHVIFLGLFSWVNIKGLDREFPRIEEYIIIFWILTLFLEELRQFTLLREPTVLKRVEVFVHDYWNVVDTIAIACFVPGVLLRFISRELTGWAHGFYVLTLILYCIRFTSFFSLHDKLGPKIVMIGKMIKDLLFFMCIFMVYVLAYGIAVQSLIYPDVTDPPFSVFWGIFVRPFYETFGEPWMEEIGATDKCTDDSEAGWPYEHCPDHGKTLFALILKCLYMVFTNVLLLNLLIAMFNYRYTEVNDESDVYWRYQMFNVIQEYYNRPKLPPPLFIFSHAKMIIKAIINLEFPRAKKLVDDPPEHIFRQLEKWEDISAKEYSMQVDRKQQENMEERVKKIESKTTAIDRAICTVQADVSKNTETVQQKMKDDSGPSSRGLDETRKTLERELTIVRENNNSLGAQVEALSSRTEERCNRLEDSLANLNERTRRMETMLEMLVKSVVNEPMRIEDLEEQR